MPVPSDFPAEKPKRVSARTMKLLGAILVLLGLVLPLYSCHGRFVDAAGREVTYMDKAGAIVPEKSIDLHQPLPSGIIRMDDTTIPPSGITYHKDYQFFFGEFSYDDPFDWFRLAGFLWPLAAVLFAMKLRHPWSRRLFRGLEPVLVLESSMALSTSAIFGTKEVGFWTAWTGIFLYSLGAASSGVTDFAAWKPALERTRRILADILIYGVFLGCSTVSVLLFFKWFVH